MHHGKGGRKGVGAALREINWKGLQLLPDAGRISVGTCQLMVLWSIHFHSEWAPHNVRNKNWKAPEWTPPMWPQDFADEIGFSRPSVIEALEDAVERGVIARKGESGPDRYRYKLLREAWPGMASVNEDLVIPKKEPKSEGFGDEDEAPDIPDVPPDAEPRHQTRVSAGSRVIWNERPLRNRTRIDLAIASEVVDGEEEIVIDEQEAADSDQPQNANGSHDYSSETTRVGVPTLVKSNGTQKHAPWKFSLSDFPISVDAIQQKKEFSGTDTDFLAKIFSLSIDRVIAQGVDPRLVTDEEMIEGLRTTLKKNQNSAGMWKHTLPPYFEAWAKRKRAQES